MKIINLDIFLWRLKRVSKIVVSNTTCFNTLSTALPYSVCNDYNTNIAKDSTFSNQQSMFNNVIVKHSSKIQNFLSHPRIVSHIMLCTERKCVGYKMYFTRKLKKFLIKIKKSTRVLTRGLNICHFFITAKQWNKLVVRENCHPAKTSLLVLIQVPLWISLSMSIRNLCYMLPKQDANAYITYQEFITDGFLWMSNLTTADPFVLPISMGLFNLAIIEITCMSKVQNVELTKWQRYLTNFCRIVIIGMIPIAMSVPSCLSLYWATSSAFGLFQNLILLSPKVRRFAKVPITTSESPHPYLILRNKIAVKYRLKKKVEIPPKM
ncbi:COX18 protein, partial [Acromyrmex heyeri]